MEEKTESSQKNIGSETKELLENLRYKGKPKLFSMYASEIIRFSLSIAEEKPQENLVGFFPFKLPEDSHFLPLFEKELFSQLVESHNANDTPDQYIDPILLMAVDPMFPRIRDGKIRGESLFEHELQHFFKWQESEGKSKEDNSFVVLSLVIKLEDGVRLLTYEIDFVPEDGLASFDQDLEIAFAPRFPSSGDIGDRIDQAKAESKKGMLGKIRWFRMLSKVQKKLDQKAAEQGMKGDPLQTREMEEKLFPKWKEKREGKIKFLQWYKPTSIKYRNSSS